MRRRCEFQDGDILGGEFARVCAKRLVNEVAILVRLFGRLRLENAVPRPVGLPTVEFLFDLSERLGV